MELVIEGQGKEHIERDRDRNEEEEEEENLPSIRGCTLGEDGGCCRV